MNETGNSMCNFERSIMKRNLTTNLLGDETILRAALAGLEAQADGITSKIEQVKTALSGRAIAKLNKLSKRFAKDVEAGPWNPAKGKRKMSAAGRKRIAAAQKKRWNAFHKAQKQQKEK
jgi:hypothetical protein